MAESALLDVGAKERLSDLATDPVGFGAAGLFMKKILFLDIDGVLNGHDDLGAYSINPKCVDQLNYILMCTEAKVVLSSSWRHLIISGEMTLRGFEVLLRSHGVQLSDGLLGHTRSEFRTLYEASLDGDSRDREILDWLKENRGNELILYVALDDMPLPLLGPRHVQTDPYIGLTEEDASKAIELLNGT